MMLRALSSQCLSNRALYARSSTSSLLRTFAASSSSAIASSSSTDAEDHSQNYKLVIVGTGWAGYKMFTQCKKHREEIELLLNKPVDIVVISKRNHFLYTPLLASTTVGTLGFRSIIEPLRDSMFRHEDDFHLSSVQNVDPIAKTLDCESELSKRQYSLRYDTLVLACGAQPMTFGLPGVTEHAFFLKEIQHARAIRNRILENFEMATQPGVSAAEKKQLLHFVVVGGGPTGIEFCAELYDFVQQDLAHMYPQTSKYLAVSLLDSGEILMGFDAYLRSFALKKIQSRPSMKLIKKNCIEVKADCVVLQGGETIPCGLVVWTAGVGPNTLTKSLSTMKKSKRGNILTNDFCQVLLPKSDGQKSDGSDGNVFGLAMDSNLFSIGDCAEIEGYPLPATAQKAQSQAEYLTNIFRGKALRKKGQASIASYSFHNKGMMAYLGSYEGLLELKLPSDHEKAPTAKVKGWKAWFIWRSAYLTKLGSWRLRLQVPLDWLKAMVVGRDVSRF